MARQCSNYDCSVVDQGPEGGEGEAVIRLQNRGDDSRQSKEDRLEQHDSCQVNGETDLKVREAVARTVSVAVDKKVHDLRCEQKGQPTQDGKGYGDAVQYA